MRIVLWIYYCLDCHSLRGMYKRQTHCQECGSDKLDYGDNVISERSITNGKETRENSRAESREVKD